MSQSEVEEASAEASAEERAPAEAEASAEAGAPVAEAEASAPVAEVGAAPHRDCSRFNEARDALASDREAPVAESVTEEDMRLAEDLDPDFGTPPSYPLPGDSDDDDDDLLGTDEPHPLPQRPTDAVSGTAPHLDCSRFNEARDALASDTSDDDDGEREARKRQAVEDEKDAEGGAEIVDASEAEDLDLVQPRRQARGATRDNLAVEAELAAAGAEASAPAAEAGA